MLNPADCIIRADASPRIGLGHLMRSLALAEAWRAQGGRVTWIGQCEAPAVLERIGAVCQTLVRLDGAHPDPTDLSITCRTLGEIRTFENQPWVIVDGYHFDAGYLAAVRRTGTRVLVIDDLAKLPFYDADLIVNQNVSAEALCYAHAHDTRLLLGPSHVLLRDEFHVWRDFPRQVRFVGRRILVTLGGGDPANVTAKVIEALATLPKDSWEAQIVVGPGNPRWSSLRSAVADLEFATLIHQPSDMPELMAWADIAVCAGGSVCWETAFMGLPTCALIVAENQVRAVEAAAAQGVLLNLGHAEALDRGSLARAISGLIFDPAKRSELSARGRSLIDGDGARRVVQAMLDHPDRNSESRFATTLAGAAP